MPDQNGGPTTPVDLTSSPAHFGLFDGLFARGPGAAPGGAVAGDLGWLRAMLAAEAALARALEGAGLAPAGAGAAVTEAARAEDFTPGDLAELGRAATLTGTPVPGLARVLSRKVASPAGRSAVHQGATSQDIMDTAAMLIARDALAAAEADLRAAAASAAELAREHRGTLMIGRTLLRHAVPTTFGMVAAGWLAGLDSAALGLASTAGTRLAVQFGGAAGTLASLGEGGARVKALMARELALADPPLPWHTERLRIIDVATAAARVTAALSPVARDVTLLAQNEVGEVAEAGAASGGPRRRGASPAMPGTGTPVAAVAILGCARQVPGLLGTLVASAEQEHQRAAGAWHAEWQPYGRLLQLCVSAAAWGRDLLAHLHVDKPRMAANLAGAGGLPLAERVTALLHGPLGAAAAHDLVAGAAARSASSGIPLRDVLLATPEIEARLTRAGITAEQVERALDPATYLGASREFVSAALAAHEAAGRPGDATG
jgi:3-carboxy-cis,cis-muconate cycloisomerase